MAVRKSSLPLSCYFLSAPPPHQSLELNLSLSAYRFSWNAFEQLSFAYFHKCIKCFNCKMVYFFGTSDERRCGQNKCVRMREICVISFINASFSSGFQLIVCLRMVDGVIQSVRVESTPFALGHSTAKNANRGKTMKRKKCAWMKIITWELIFVLRHPCITRFKVYSTRTMEKNTINLFGKSRGSIKGLLLQPLEIHINCFIGNETWTFNQWAVNHDKYKKCALTKYLWIFSTSHLYKMKVWCCP